MSTPTSPQPPVGGAESIIFDVSDWLVIATIFVAAISWVVSYWFARRLLRKQLAITILHENLFVAHRLDAMREVFDVVRLNKDFNWEKLAKDNTKTGNNKNKKKPANSQLFAMTLIVMNYFEFLSIAVLTKSINEDIIKLSHRSNFSTLYRRAEKFIGHLRAITENPNYFCQYEAIVNRWAGKDKAKGRF